MANYCDYEVRVTGTKNAGYMVYCSMPCTDYKELESVKKSGTNYLTIFTGNCDWSVNYGVREDLSVIDVDKLSEKQIEKSADNYWYYSLRSKSEAFNCEIMVHYWSEESGFDQFDCFKNGKVIKQRKVAFDYDSGNKFDWDKKEFVGHEGEYDESVDGESKNNEFMAKLLSIPGAKAPNGQPSLSDIINATTGYVKQPSNKSTSKKTESPKRSKSNNSNDASAKYGICAEGGKPVKIDNYEVIIPKTFAYKLNYEDRRFVAWYTENKKEDASHSETSAISFMEAVSLAQSAIVGIGTNPYQISREQFEQSQMMNQFIKIAEEYDFIEYSNGSVTGGATVQVISNSCVNYHCVIGTKKDIKQIRIVINNRMSRKNKDQIAIAILDLFSFGGTKENNNKTKDSASKAANEKAKIDEARKYGVDVKDLAKHKKYLAAKEQMESAKTETEFLKVAEKFGKISTYKDSSARQASCQTKAKELKLFDDADIEYDKAISKYNSANKVFEKLKEEYFSLKTDYDNFVSEYEKEKANYDGNIRKINDDCKLELSSIDHELEKVTYQYNLESEKLQGLEYDLADTFALNFGRKKQLTQAVEVQREIIYQLADQQNALVQTREDTINNCNLAQKALSDRINELVTSINKHTGLINKLVEKVNKAQQDKEKAERKVGEIELKYGTDVINKVKNLWQKRKEEAELEEKREKESQEAKKRKEWDDYKQGLADYLRKEGRPLHTEEIPGSHDPKFIKAVNELIREGKVYSTNCKGRIYYAYL